MPDTQPNHEHTRGQEQPKQSRLEAAMADAPLQDETPSNEWAFVAPSADPFWLLGLRYLYEGPFPSNGVVAVDVELGKLLLERLDGAAIDAFPTNLVISLPELPLPPAGGVAEARAGYEVTDPRLNHRIEEWVATSNATPRAINQAARDAWEADDRTDPFETWSPAGLTNGLEAAWIGFLPIGEPWRSVDLFGEDGRWWLAHTRDPGAVLGRWERGRVNPNGPYTSAVAAVFADVPVESWPGEPGALGLSYELALGMAADMRVAVNDGSGSVHRADWAWAVEDRLLATLGEEGRHQAEAVVRQSYRLFEPGGQVWGIWMMAERRSAAPASTWPRRRALALVWWDPFPDLAGWHAWSLLRWLDLPESGN